MADWQQSGPDTATADAEDRAGTPAADPPIRRPRGAFPLLFVVVFGLGLAALVGLWRAGLLPGNDGGFRGFVMSPPRPAPAIPLATSAGEPFSLEAARGRVVMLFFGYTYCPDVCPKALGRMAAALDVLGADAERVLVLTGSGAEAAEDVVRDLNAAGEQVGLLKVRLFRPPLRQPPGRLSAPGREAPRGGGSDQGSRRCR